MEIVESQTMYRKVARIVKLVLDAEHAFAALVQESLSDQLGRRTACGVTGIQRQPRLGPLGTSVQPSSEEVGDARVSGRDEGAGERTVVVDQLLANFEDVACHVLVSPIPVLILIAQVARNRSSGPKLTEGSDHVHGRAIRRQCPDNKNHQRHAPLPHSGLCSPETKKWRTM